MHVMRNVTHVTSRYSDHDWSLFYGTDTATGVLNECYKSWTFTV